MPAEVAWQWDGLASRVVVLHEGGRGLLPRRGLPGRCFRRTRLGLEFHHELPRGLRDVPQPCLEFPLSVDPGRATVDLRPIGAGGVEQDEDREQWAHSGERFSQRPGASSLREALGSPRHLSGLPARPRGAGEALEGPFRCGELAVQLFPLTRLDVLACPRQQCPDLVQAPFQSTTDPVLAPSLLERR